MVVARCEIDNDLFFKGLYVYVIEEGPDVTVRLKGTTFFQQLCMSFIGAGTGKLTADDIKDFLWW